MARNETPKVYIAPPHNPSSNHSEYGSEARALLAERVNQFAAQFDEYRRQTYNETEVRVDFVNPFFRSLGWDVDNTAGLPQHLREVTHEATVMVEENGRQRSKKPDYSFRIGTETLFYLETKKPSVNITVDASPAFQLRRYGWSGNLKISVLTNFSDLYIYDCSIRPIENDGVGVALIAHYHYTEYVDKFDEIYQLISKEAVISGTFATTFENIHSTLRREPFDEYFLKQISDWRINLGADIARHNSGIEDSTLNIAVQRILNRIIFLRICEDRNLENYESLKNIHTYNELKALFLSADQKYDSGLFDMLEEDCLLLSDTVLIDIFRNLYYPNSSYEFSVVDPFIIGQIYELFLEEQLNIDPDGDVLVIKKPEAVDSQGAVNTPKNVTDIIVEQTISTLLKEKNITEAEHLHLADICCGSGNFLLSAFEYMTNYFTEELTSNYRQSALREGKIYQVSCSSEFRLSFAERRRILTNNIFGVDIDPLAVEVAKFSLFLKLLENTPAEETEAFMRQTGEKILPRMDNNILNGNSLVGSSYAHFMPEIYNNRQKMEEIRMFDFSDEFRFAFDAIVGNPPYIRVQNMVHYSPDEYAFLKSDHSGFITSKSDLLDKYYLFIERALSLLAPGGVVGYIVPHKFMNIASGEVLRGYLAEEKAIKKIVHFGTHQAFRGRSTYTCILILQKSYQEEFQISFVADWNRFLFDHNIEWDTYKESQLSETPWTFIPHDITKQLDLLQDQCSELRTVADIFVGVQTSNDKIYIIHADREDDKHVYFTDKTGIKRKIERQILRKSIYDARLTKYEHIEANSYIIFPYINCEGKPQLIDISIMRSQFPKALEYLSAFRKELDKRNMPNRTEDTWYAYGRSQSLKRFISNEHLIWPVLSLESNYVYDDELVVFTGGGNGPFYGIEMKPDVSESIFYVQAVLNHWLMELLVRETASTFRGGYYSHGKQFIEKLPIYRIDFCNPDEKEAHDNIVKKVHTIERLKAEMQTAQTSSSKETLRRSADAALRELSYMIDQLYGVEHLRTE